jgi:predicted ATPase
LKNTEPPEALWSYPEILRVEAELILLTEAKDAEKKAETRLMESFDLATSQSLLSWELRSAVSLARLWTRLGRAAKARTMLKTTYDKFTEGFATRDLSVARQMIDELG